MEVNYLYQELETLRKSHYISYVPEYIQYGLSSHIQLRDYQIQALENSITYWENEGLSKNKQTHLLYHMATGSGKTVIMAAMIIYLYKQGYRNFLFFVNRNNIVEKTKDNFINSSSSKFLFANPVELFGERIKIQSVDNFSMTDNSAINICFKTIQGLHDKLTFPEENGLTIEEIEDQKTVLIADESHHVNTMTKNPTKDDKEIKSSWENSVTRLFRANRGNVLLEFTATADLKDPNLQKKYSDKLIFDYPLQYFRKSGFTKDFRNMSFDYDPWKRTLIALIINEYRRYKFADMGQNIKPVVLLKSQRIPDSENFYKKFFQRLNDLQAEDIKDLRNNENVFLKDALSYFASPDDGYQSLVQSLQISFAEHASIIMNGKRDDTDQKQLLVNSLEDQDNPYRLIFTVDMLNEGWDVLNLFDIVRLYETRQSGKDISPYTIKEAQLIGRGARYCPFVHENPEERFIRKYDRDLMNQNRILETLLYHSRYDHRYITEINQALKEQGLLPGSEIELTYHLKDEFKDKDIFKQGVVFTNKRVPKARTKVTQMESKIRNRSIRYEVPSGRGNIYSMFSDTVARAKTQIKTTETFQLRNMPYNILQFAIANYDALKFNLLQSYFPNIQSTKEFLTSEDYIGSINITIESPADKIFTVNKYRAVKKALNEVSDYIMSIKGEFKGSATFEAVPVSKAIYDKKIKLTDIKENGQGKSQAEVEDDNLRLDLSDKSWYIFNDHYGTSEEKAFVRYFADHINTLKQTYTEVYLIRNERFPQLAIYTFDDGARFEPDFIIFLRKKGVEGFIQEQIYVEPKGNPYLEEQIWKEEFLLELENKAIPYKIYADDNEYQIIGLPFYNQDHRMEEFTKEFDRIAKDED